MQGDNPDDSIDSFDVELARVDKDFDEKILDKDLMVDKRNNNLEDSNRQNSVESDDEDKSNMSNVNPSDKDGKKNDEDSDDE